LPASGGTHGFAAALTSALLPGAEGAANSPEAALPEGLVRQKSAGDGKDLPKGFGETAEDGDDKDDAADIAFAWFGMAPVVPESAPIVVKLPLPAGVIAVPEGEVLAPVDLAAVAPASDLVSLDTGAAAHTLPATGGASEFTLPTPVAGEPVAPPAEGEAAAPQRIELPPARVSAPGTQPIALAIAQLRAETAQPVSAMLQPLVAAGLEAPTPIRRQLRELTAALAPTTQVEAPRATAVTAIADAQQGALDMRRQEWMGAMVEHIEALRDASPARETNIRLAPDALGSVDISIRHDGDRVHVRFTADTAAARTLLADAQPRLAELAEARGLRLGQTSVDSGGQGNQRQAPTPHAAFPSAPASARAAETESTEDRIA